MKKTFEQFNELIKERFKDHYPSVYIDEKFVGGRYNGKMEPCDPYIQLKWETGGVSGGSCWESSNPQPYTNNKPEPEFQDLDDILLEFCPGLSFLQYKQLNKLIVVDEDTEYEYYGNRVDYAVKRIKVKDLYEFIFKNKA